MNFSNFKKTTNIFLLLVVVLSASFVGIPKRAHATLPVIDYAHIAVNTERMVQDAANLETNIITTGSQLITEYEQAILTYEFNWKEYITDLVSFIFKNIALGHVTDEIFDWIDSGFQYPSGALGSFFPTNPSALFADLVRESAGVFLEDFAGIDICDPTWEQRFSTGFEYKYIGQPSLNERIGCTAIGVPEFIADFDAGGWSTWGQMVSEPQNNPYGLYRVAVKELESRMLARQDRESTELSWGDGSLSEKLCVDWAGDWCRRWESFTPGQAIVKELNKVLENPITQFEHADEFTEVIDAFFSSMINDLISGQIININQGVYF